MEALGASVVQKDAIVVRSKPPYERRKIFSRMEVEGTHNDVCVLDAFSQHIPSVFPSPRFRCVLSFPYRTEALLSESNDTEGAMESQNRPLPERPGVSWRVWFSVEDPVWWKQGDRIVVLRIENSHHLTCRCEHANEGVSCGRAERFAGGPRSISAVIIWKPKLGVVLGSRRSEDTRHHASCINGDRGRV